MAGLGDTISDEDIRQEVIRARDQAEAFHGDPELTRSLVVEAMKQLKRKNALGVIYNDMNTALRMVGASVEGKYESEWGTVREILAGAIYLISPLDLVPDFAPGGLVDDAAVISTVLIPLKDRLDAYRGWEKKQEK